MINANETLEVEAVNEEPKMVEIPVEMYVNLKSAAIQMKNGRPITLPADLTPDEYAFFKKYMDAQYKKLTAKVPFPPKKIKIVKNEPKNETS